MQRFVTACGQHFSRGETREFVTTRLNQFPAVDWARILSAVFREQGCCEATKSGALQLCAEGGHERLTAEQLEAEAKTLLKLELVLELGRAEDALSSR